MRPQTPFPKGAAERLAVLMKQVESKSEFQRIQCVWLRASLGLSVAEIATAVGRSPNTVRGLHSRFLRYGEAAFAGVGRGGRRHQNLTVEEERELLRGFFAQAESGGVLEVSAIKAAYEERIDRPVPKSTIYRMLARHGWRKLAPRPRHPKAAREAQPAFKKNSPSSSRRKRGGKRSKGAQSD